MNLIEYKDDGIYVNGVKPSAGGGISNAWPVGSIFIATVATNPATLLGFGTWSAFGAGKVLVGLDSDIALGDAVTTNDGMLEVTMVEWRDGTCRIEAGKPYSSLRDKLATLARKQDALQRIL